MSAMNAVSENGDTPRVLGTMPGTENVAVNKTDSADEFTKPTGWE